MSLFNGTYSMVLIALFFRDEDPQALDLNKSLFLSADFMSDISISSSLRTSLSLLG